VEVVREGEVMAVVVMVVVVTREVEAGETAELGEV